MQDIFSEKVENQLPAFKLVWETGSKKFSMCWFSEFKIELGKNLDIMEH